MRLWSSWWVSPIKEVRSSPSSRWKPPSATLKISSSTSRMWVPSALTFKLTVNNAGSIYVEVLLQFSIKISTLDQFKLPVGGNVVCAGVENLLLDECLLISVCSSQLYLWKPLCSQRLRPPSSTPSSLLSPWQVARLASSFSSTILIPR